MNSNILNEINLNNTFFNKEYYMYKIIVRFNNFLKIIFKKLITTNNAFTTKI